MPDLSQRLTAALADRYRIERELGRGGMATVFLAEDVKHVRRVAIKVLDPEVAAAIGPERFLREIATVARLTHPHILPLHDSGVADGLLFYVMPYVEGESLRERLTREKQLSVDDALRIAREVADALSYAHSRGVVHRDVKPENILLEQVHAVVADFGIARAVAAAGEEKLTATGIAVGTPTYMSPEQAVGSRDVDGRSDLYSLGCVLYEMLAGQPPFTGPTVESLVHQHLNVSPRAVTELRPAVPAPVAVALQRALAKVPADRFNPVALFGEALGSGATTSPVPTPVAPAVARRRPAPWLVPVALAVIAALVAVAVWQHWRPFGAGPSGKPAKKEWILVAEFAAQPADSAIATAARSLVSAALDQSEILATVPRDQVQLALQNSGKPPGTRMNADVAREVAFRRAVRAVLEGDIGHVGDAYSVVLRAVDAESLRVVVTERGTARNADALIPTLGRMAEKLRRDLGEKRDALAATRPMTDAATPSFEAYRRWLEGERLRQAADWDGAISVYRDALRLDPGFASAWIGIGIAQGNAGRRDSALAAYNQAMVHPERLTPGARLELESLHADWAGDWDLALAAMARWVRIEPDNPVALARYAGALGALGYFEQALARFEEAAQKSPFGPSATLRSNIVLGLLDLGRVDRAREMARALGAFGPARRTQVELAACNWVAAESLANNQLHDPTLQNATSPSAASLRLAEALAGRGALRASREAMLRAAQAAESVSPLLKDLAGRSLLFLANESQGGIEPPSMSWASDNPGESSILGGLTAVSAGDGTSARRFLVEARRLPGMEERALGAAPILLEARIAGLDGRWTAVIDLLRPVALRSVDLGAWVPGTSTTTLLEARLTLADAFEEQGALDSAAVWLERVANDPATWAWAGIARPFAHLRLALLQARMGRFADAERHLAVLEHWWDRPDDIARRMLAEARAAVASARGTARPHRAGV